MKKFLEVRAIGIAQAICWWGGIFGGTLLLSHFLKIKYLPRFDIASLMGTIAGVAGAGFILLIVMGMILVLPGLVLELGDESGMASKLPRRVKDEEGDRGAVLKQRKMHLSCWLWGSSSAVLVLVLLLFINLPDWTLASFFCGAASLWVFSLIHSLIWGMRPFKSGRAWMTLHFFICFAMFGSASFVFLYSMAGSGSEVFRIESAIIIIISVMASQCVIYFSQGDPMKVRGALLGGVAMMLITTTSISNLYSERIGTMFRFGVMANAELIVTDRACSILAAAALDGVRCQEQPEDGGVRSTGPVDVWTRIGSDTLLSASGTLGQKDVDRVLLPNDEVLSVRWRRARD